MRTVRRYCTRLASVSGVTLSMHIEPTDAEALIKGINRAMGDYAGRLEMGGNALTVQRLEWSLGDAQVLLRKLNQEQQQVFFVTVLVLVTARKKAELDKRVRIEGMFAAFGIRARLLADPQTPQALASLRDTSKRIRKYMGSLVVISQNVIDFLAPEIQRHGQAILDNPTYKLLLAQGENDRQILAGLMRLSESEEEFLATANRGEGLLVAGAQRVRVKMEAAPYELQYLTRAGQ